MVPVPVLYVNLPSINGLIFILNLIHIYLVYNAEYILFRQCIDRKMKF